MDGRGRAAEAFVCRGAVPILLKREGLNRRSVAFGYVAADENGAARRCQAGKVSKGFLQWDLLA